MMYNWILGTESNTLPDMQGGWELLDDFLSLWAPSITLLRMRLEGPWKYLEMKGGKEYSGSGGSNMMVCELKHQL